MARKRTDIINQDNKPEFVWTYIETIFCIVSVLILCAPFLFAKFYKLDFFEATGQIGDTIGGITAPLTGLFGAWLVYKALKAQIVANDVIINQFKLQQNVERNNKRLQYITDQIKILREDIKDFIFIEPSLVYSDYNEHPGVTGISKMLEHYARWTYHNLDIEEYEEQGLHELKNFLSTILYLINLTFLLEEEDKSNLVRVISESYRTRLYIYLKLYEGKRLASQPECDDCPYKHGLPEYIYVLYDSINAKLGFKDDRK